ncbi:hypothetical protein B0H16DRAFT_1698003 [Mycena metata]|uniref:Uncharacterized protein n=1 Tax=Mycena metata TaxID=1033252 RepID=A0AAD7HRH9_9AGAR|nr:hypothetical protein B0H16DRAFT_1698003 [Mycena metata]
MASRNMQFPDHHVGVDVEDTTVFVPRDRNTLYWVSPVAPLTSLARCRFSDHLGNKKKLELSQLILSGKQYQERRAPMRGRTDGLEGEDRRVSEAIRISQSWAAIVFARVALWPGACLFDASFGSKRDFTKLGWYSVCICRGISLVNIAPNSDSWTDKFSLLYSTMTGGRKSDSETQRPKVVTSKTHIQRQCLGVPDSVVRRDSLRKCSATSSPFHGVFNEQKFLSVLVLLHSLQALEILRLQCPPQASDFRRKLIQTDYFVVILSNYLKSSAIYSSFSLALPIPSWFARNSV